MHHDAGFDAHAAPPHDATGGHDEPERTYPVDPHTPIVLDVSCQSADVSIRAAARPDLLVRARGAGDRTGTADAPPGLHVAADGNRIAVSTHPDEWTPAHGGGGAGGPRERRRGLGGWLSFGRFAAESVTSVEIETPVGASVRLTLLSGAGDVRLDGLAGEITVRAGAGDLLATGCVGQVQADAGAGDVRLVECNATLRVQTGSGDVAVERGSLEAGRFRSGSGDLSIRGTGLGSGPFEVQTGAGDVLLDVYRLDRGDDPIGIRYVALAGDAHIGPGFSRLRGRSAESAQPLVTVHTASGDLVARRTTAPAAATDEGTRQNDEEWAAATRIPVASPPPPTNVPDPPMPPTNDAPAPPELPEQPDVEVVEYQPTHGDMLHEGSDTPEPAPGNDRIAVLEAVARGDLDIEEALRRLG